MYVNTSTKNTLKLIFVTLEVIHYKVSTKATCTCSCIDVGTFCLLVVDTTAEYSQPCVSTLHVCRGVRGVCTRRKTFENLVLRDAI